MNTSLDMIENEIIRALNVMERIRTGKPNHVLTMNFLTARASLPINWLVEHAMRFNIDSLRLDDTAPALATLHANIAARYRMAQVDPVQLVGLFEPRTATVPFVRPDYLIAEGVMETLRDMHRQLLPTGQ